VPGRSPHPRRDPKGHAYGTAEPKPPPVDAARWRESPIYLLGIDLYNHAYWWECHEALEALWHAVGHTTPTGQFLQGIIQVAAANLKRFVRETEGLPSVAPGRESAKEGARRLWTEGLARHAGLPGRYMGVDVAVFGRDVKDYFEGRRDTPALITLEDA
jgi:hypothetical protein